VTRAAAENFGVHDGHFCVGVVTDKSPGHVKAVVKAAVVEAGKVTAAEHNRAVRALGHAPKQTEECLKALKRGAAGATVAVSGPLTKPEKQRAALAKAEEGLAAAPPKPAGAAPKSDRAAAACPGSHALPAKGAALAALYTYVNGTGRMTGSICGDRVVIAEKSAGAAGKIGSNADKKAKLEDALAKTGEAGRLFWHAASLAVPAGTAAPAPKAVAAEVFAALKK
jgi:hypothetical protein